MKTWTVGLLALGLLAACDNTSNNRTTGSGTSMSGATSGSGGLSRPNPTGSAGGGVAQPSNNPMNDPVGGSGQAVQPGFNQNR